MEPAVTPANRRHPEAGVTLIELVVVMAVMASLVLGAVLIRPPGAGAAGRDLQRFRAAYDQARSLAVHGQTRRGLALTAAGLRVSRWSQAARLNGGWLDRGRMDSGWQISAQLQPWRGRVSYQIAGPGAVNDTPDILFLANGQTTAFSIQFDQGQCHSDGWTGLICAVQ